MATILLYMLKASIALGGFYGLYVLLFRNDTFWEVKRLVLMLMISFSLAYPLISIPSWGSAFSRLFSSTSQAASSLVVTLEAPLRRGMGSSLEIPQGEGDFAWMLLGGYCLVTLFFLLRYIGQIFYLIALRVGSDKVDIEGIRVYRLERERGAFSFFRWIFIGSEKYSEEEMARVLSHEMIHVTQWHSVDVLLAELLRVFFWWNPFAWLLKREVVDNLEFLADNGVLNQGVDRKSYQYQLLRLSYPNSAIRIVNNFNISQLKKRIVMMNQLKSPAWKLLRYVLVVPFLFAFVALNSVSATSLSYSSDPLSVFQEATPKSMDLASSTSLLEPLSVQNLLPQKPKGKNSPKANAKGWIDLGERFPGGMEGLKKFLNDNIGKLPTKEDGTFIQGKVIVDFQVAKDGTITDAKVIKADDPALEGVALELMSKMPKWTPGTQVISLNMPIIFKAPKDQKKK